MHDQVRLDLPTLRKILAELADLRDQVRQFSRQRFPRQHNSPHDELFCVVNEEIGHHGSGEVEIVVRNADNSGWERSGDKFEATDIFLNTDDDPIEVKTIVTVIWYDGVEAINGIYCRPSDWIGDPPEEEP